MASIITGSWISSPPPFNMKFKCSPFFLMEKFSPFFCQQPETSSLLSKSLFTSGYAENVVSTYLFLSK